nr:pentatricopeptide repeat-containing protein At1g50270 [Ipomoea batatas]
MENQSSKPGQITDEEAQSWNKRKLCSGYKLTEINGINIFFAGSENDASESETNGNLSNRTSVRINSLVSTFVVCAYIKLLRKVFVEMQKRDVISYTALIDGFKRNRRSAEALELFLEMKKTGVRVDEGTVVSVHKFFLLFNFFFKITV